MLNFYDFSKHCLSSSQAAYQWRDISSSDRGLNLLKALPSWSKQEQRPIGTEQVAGSRVNASFSSVKLCAHFGTSVSIYS